jgi:hypothetical protein
VERERFSSDVFTAPAFAGFSDLLGDFSRDCVWPSLSRLQERWLTARAVCSADGHPLTLVEQTVKRRRGGPRSRSELYDVSVCAGRVPTRSESWHDFFNVMMFAAFPRSKATLHHRHRTILEARLPLAVTKLPGARTTEQDALTMLDEGGVLLASTPEDGLHLDAVLDDGNHDALRRLIAEGRCRPWLFGHAHAEHIVLALQGAALPLPRAKPVRLAVAPDASRPQVDDALAERLCDPAFCAENDHRRAVAIEVLFSQASG